MPRMDESKRLSQPLTTLRIEGGKNPGEICLVFAAWCFSFVQELEFGGEIWDTIRRSVSYGRKWATNTWIAPEEPLVIDGIANYELDRPWSGLVWTAPDIMDTWTESLARFPLLERPCRGKPARVCSLDVPLTQKRANLLLITSENLYIDVLMLSCLFSEEKIESPSASDPPGNRQCGEESGNLLRRPGLPATKLICFVYHTIIFHCACSIE